MLSAVRYGETSKVVRLATRDAGVVSAIAKGAMRPRSRFGAALQSLSRGQAHIIPARSSDLHTLVAFDLVHLPAGLGRDLDRFTGAAALAEVVLRCSPSAAHPEIFEELAASVAALEEAEAGAAGRIVLRGLWRIVALLGFEPALDQCALDGRVLPADGPLPFSAREGGGLCQSCARTHTARVLPPQDRRDLTELLHGAGAPPTMAPRHEQAHRRLVADFIRHQAAEGSRLPALEVWQRGDWTGAA